MAFGAANASLLWRVQERLSYECPRREIQSYCETVAKRFDFTPEQLAVEGGDGYDHRHEWHDAHRGFAELIERLLGDALAAEGADREEFIAQCGIALGAKEQAPTMLRFFMSMLLDSGDYVKFVELMKVQHRMRARMESYCPPEEEDCDAKEDGALDSAAAA
mmetsp:Transcript_145905/g.406402  ORF Transcript_145905/g.406402 Transcript_145905/m.406402 type:complete len:162 (+) Transcript_145905:58-543(+)